MNLPNLLIAGVAHGGTTSLFTYLSTHPEICSSTIKETHYFYPIMIGEELPPIHEYEKYFLHHENEPYIMEAGPGYLYGGEKLARIIKEKLGHVKLIFILRNPVERLYSYFKYCNKTMLIDILSFKEFVNSLKGNSNHFNIYKEEIKKERTAIGLESGFYVNYLQEWYSVFDEKSITVLFFDDLKTSPQSLIRKICHWLSINAHISKKDHFSIENKGFYYKSRAIQRIALNLNEKMEPFFRAHPNIKQIVRRIYMLNAKENPFQLDEVTNDYLTDLYTSHNAQLYYLLIAKGYFSEELPDWLKKAK